MIARFTPLERQFHAWHDTARDIFTQIGYHHGEMERMKTEQWPNPAIRKQYDAWARSWNGRHFDRMRYRITPEEFIDKVRHLNFTSSTDVGGFLWMMKMLNPPSLLLGKCKYGGVDTYYLVRPGVCYLWPHIDNAPEALGIMDRAILAVDTNISVDPSQNRRKKNTSDGSDDSNSSVNASGAVRSTDSGDISTNQAFVFAQLGRMYSFAGAQNAQPSKSDTYRGPWEPTDFGVVVQLDSRGRTGAVWVIYNFFQIDTDSEDRTPQHVDVHSDTMGRLPHIERPTEGVAAWNRFTVAKIADSLNDLRDDPREFEFQDKIYKEVMIVRAKVDGGRWLLPQFVSKGD